MSKSTNVRRRTVRTNSRNRNTHNLDETELRASKSPAPPQELRAPNVGGELLSGNVISFLAFLADEHCQDYCAALFSSSRVVADPRRKGRRGRGTRANLRAPRSAAAAILEEFRKAAEFHYYGHRRAKPGRKKPSNPGKLTATNTATKKLLKRFARLAYRGDPGGRGQEFWERVAWLVWSAYAGLMALRVRAEKIRQQENQRTARLPAKRVARAAYMRRYRAKQRAKESRYFTPDARQRWRKRQAGSQ